MPGRPHKVPSYTLHSASGRAVVRLNRKDYYLGVYGSDESHERYARLIAEWQAGGASSAAAPSEVGRKPERDTSAWQSVAKVLQRYKAFCESYYLRDGKPTKELVAIGYAMRPLRELYGSLCISSIGPLALKAIQQHIVGQEICRNQINARTNRIRRFFKWAVSEELAPPSAYEALRTVSGLRYGRTAAKESPPVRPVADEHVDGVMPFLSDEVRSMVRLQRLNEAFQPV